MWQHGSDPCFFSVMAAFGFRVNQSLSIALKYFRRPPSGVKGKWQRKPSYRCRTSQEPGPGRRRGWSAAHCRWCRGSWWWTLIGPPACRWWSGWWPWRAGCSRLSPPGPAAWWHGCLLTSRQSWTTCRHPRLLARSARCRRRGPSPSGAAGWRSEGKKRAEFQYSPLNVTTIDFIISTKRFNFFLSWSLLIRC